jgi:glycerol-3-phosphate dehydrogenase (NAD(P)+)
VGGKKRIAVVGTGAWGTTLAVMLARTGRDVALCGRTEEEAAALRASRETRRFLPGVPLPDDLTVTSSLEQALDSCAMLMMVVPAQTMRENVRRVRPHVHEDTVVLSAAKGWKRRPACV